jgi:hypothetical protein
VYKTETSGQTSKELISAVLYLRECGSLHSKAQREYVVDKISGITEILALKEPNMNNPRLQPGVNHP